MARIAKSLAVALLTFAAELGCGNVAAEAAKNASPVEVKTKSRAATTSGANASRSNSGKSAESSAQADAQAANLTDGIRLTIRIPPNFAVATEISKRAQKWLASPIFQTLPEENSVAASTIWAALGPNQELLIWARTKRSTKATEPGSGSGWEAVVRSAGRTLKRSVRGEKVTIVAQQRGEARSAQANATWRGTLVDFSIDAQRLSGWSRYDLVQSAAFEQTLVWTLCVGTARKGKRTKNRCDESRGVTEIFVDGQRAPLGDSKATTLLDAPESGSSSDNLANSGTTVPEVREMHEASDAPVTTWLLETLRNDSK